ncbi:MAG: hypothetical protein V3T43_06295 [Nitrosomonadaceae bacterium]
MTKNKFSKESCFREFQLRQRLGEILWKRMRPMGSGATNDTLDDIMELFSQNHHATKKEVVDFLREKGHGGGNWRRLLEQLTDTP